MKQLILLIILLFTYKVYAQGYSNEKITIPSEILQDSITIDLHVPETFKFSANDTKYPITVIFDSQHERTYPQIIQALNLLTSESQMPESIIIGIPFTRNNRYYYTSNKTKENDSLSGIEKMEKFLFDEILPTLQNEYKANQHLTLIGHSRTAFLVNYLLVKQNNKIDVAVALSGFYSNPPLSVEHFTTHISDSSHFSKPLHYYYTAGNTLEEGTYLKECTDVSEYIVNHTMPSNFVSHFTENKNANHMTNFWTSVPMILMDYYSPYNSILNNWFYVHLKKDSIQKPVMKFKLELQQLSKQLGFTVNPNLTQIF